MDDLRPPLRDVRLPAIIAPKAIKPKYMTVLNENCVPIESADVDDIVALRFEIRPTRRGPKVSPIGQVMTKTNSGEMAPVEYHQLPRNTQERLASGFLQLQSAMQSTLPGTLPQIIGNQLFPNLTSYIIAMPDFLIAISDTYNAWREEFEYRGPQDEGDELEKRRRRENFEISKLVTLIIPRKPQTSHETIEMITTLGTITDLISLCFPIPDKNDPNRMVRLVPPTFDEITTI
jgi:hypothetical protein